jgi:hypothetical protein
MALALLAIDISRRALASRFRGNRELAFGG